MLFSDSRKINAHSLPFNWNADYADGTQYSEYNLETQKKNDFYLIQYNKVVKFGLFGMGSKLFFEMSDGSFNLNGKRVEIEYHTDGGEILHLTTNFQRKDLITYKEAYSDFSGRQGEHKSNLKSINFGYKTKYSNAKQDISLHLQFVVSLPTSGRPYMEVRITPDRALNGHLVFKVRGIEVERYEAPMTSDRAGQINWDIK